MKIKLLFCTTIALFAQIITFAQIFSHENLLEYKGLPEIDSAAIQKAENIGLFTKFG